MSPLERYRRNQRVNLELQAAADAVRAEALIAAVPSRSTGSAHTTESPLDRYRREQAARALARLTRGSRVR